MRISDWSSDVCSSDLEHGAAEVLFQPVGHIGPEILNFARGFALGIGFHHGPAVDHRGSEIGAVMESNRRNLAMLRQGDRRLISDLGASSGGVDDDQQPLARTRSDEHTSERQSLMRNSYSGLC